MEDMDETSRAKGGQGEWARSRLEDEGRGPKVG